MSTVEPAERLLKLALGDAAEFRDGQLEAIAALVDGRSRVLVVQRTGWGKSVVYFIATSLLREQGLGPTILISPLLSLMRDQMRMATTLGLRASTINSTNATHWGHVEQALKADEVDLLLVSPERLANARFQTKTLQAIPRGIGLFVVDEAHCISDWGHDFRPDYRRIRRITEALPPTVPLLATTATANNRVVADIEDQLGPNLVVIRGPLARESLHLQVNQLEDQAQRLAWLTAYLNGIEGSGIIYTLTVADALRVSRWLANCGINAPAYYGSVDTDERLQLEASLRDNKVKALVATVALGMGFDKPDLAFVIHFQRPPSAIDYYQQIGRAGRAVDRAEVILLAGKEDEEIADHFIEGAFPPDEVMQDVLATVAEMDGAGTRDIESQVNTKSSVIEQALKILEVEGAVARDGSKRIRTPNPWKLDSERIEAVTEQRRREQARMSEYVGTGDCLMSYLTTELDDATGGDCGRCANCAEPFAAEAPDPALVLEAVSFLKRAHRPIEPRKRWPGGLSGHAGAIADEQRLREGRALAVYGDAGWGKLIKEGKYGGTGFADELVEAVIEMVLSDLKPDPFPTWVTAVPSLRHPELVPSFAQRLADRLGLPYRSTLVKVRNTPQQKTMENNFMQARNAIEAFQAIPENVAPESVFLIDDMVDSRWSLTVCGVALAEAGAGPVYPIVLGQTTSGTAS